MRKLATHEGIIENEHLPSDAGVPEQTRVDVLLPDAERLSAHHVASPHLADPQRARDFQMQVIEDATNADV